MEIPQRQIDRYVERPDPGHRAIVLFGSNEGLIRERARRIGKSVCPDLEDPFQVVRLSGLDIKDDPARLADEFGALSMFGGRRLIFLDGPNVQMLNALKSIIAGDIAGDALIIVDAPGAAKTAALTKLFSASKSAAAIGCYPEDARSISSLVEEILSEGGLTAPPDVMAELGALLGADRGLIRQQLDLLVLYKGDDKTPVSQGDIQALFEAGPTQALHSLTDQIFTGNIKQLTLYLAVCQAEGYGSSIVLRSLNAHAGLLRLIQSKRRSGADWNSLFRALRPPMHFSRQPLCRLQADRWPERALQKCQDLLQEAELKCRTRSTIENVIAERALMAVSQLAPALPRQGQ